MKDFLITAEALPSGPLFSGYAVGRNLREAWYYFKLLHKNYNRLRFRGARTSQRFYSKVN